MTWGYIGEGKGLGESGYWGGGQGEWGWGKVRIGKVRVGKKGSRGKGRGRVGAREGVGKSGSRGKEVGENWRWGKGSRRGKGEG